MSDKKEIEQLKQEIEKLNRQRDEAYANRDLHQKLLQEKVDVTNELYEALEDLWNSVSGGKKSCGHDFTCICAQEKTKQALAKARGE